MEDEAFGLDDDVVESVAPIMIELLIEQFIELFLELPIGFKMATRLDPTELAG